MKERVMVEYYFKHYYKGQEMARGLRFQASCGEEEAREYAKREFLRPYGFRECSDSFHRYELIEAKSISSGAVSEA